MRRVASEWCEHIYVRNVAEQARYAVTAFDRAMAALVELLGGRPDPAMRRAAMDEFWLQLQSFLAFMANVSKPLWGPAGADRAALRAALGVPDTSVLRPKQVRNSFEHLDERLEEWWAKDPRHGYGDHSVGDVGTDIAVSSTHSVMTWFRNYGPESGELSFWGQTLNAPEAARELADLRDKASQA